MGVRVSSVERHGHLVVIHYDGNTFELDLLSKEMINSDTGVALGLLDKQTIIYDVLDSSNLYGTDLIEHMRRAVSSMEEKVKVLTVSEKIAKALEADTSLLDRIVEALAPVDSALADTVRGFQ